MVWLVLKQIYEQVNVQEVKEAPSLLVNMMDSVSSYISDLLPKVINLMLCFGNYRNINA